MIGSAIYYFSLSVICLAIAIYNLHISSEGKIVKCYKIVQMDSTTYLQYNSSLVNVSESDQTLLNMLGLSMLLPGDSNEPVLGDSNTDTSANNSVNSTLRFLQDINNPIPGVKIYSVPVPQTNVLQILQKAAGAIYIVMLIFSLGLFFMINSLANMVPEEFAHISKFKRILACLCKVLPFLEIILHWLILLIILIIWGLFGTNMCKVSVSTQPGVVMGIDRYYKDTYVLNIVTSAFWILIHYGGAIARDIVYQEPFMYSPDVGNESCVKKLLFKKLGP